MKQLQNNFTTPEQSKRLLDLGVPADNADCYYQWETNNSVGYKLYVGEHPAIRENLFSYRNGYIIPCWSVGRLIEIAILCTQHYTGSDVVQFQRECLNYGLIECLIALLQVSKDDGDLDFSKLEE